MNLRQRSLALVILPLGLVLGLILLIAVFGARIQQAETVARDTNAGLAASNDLLVNLQIAEVQANGYALTGDAIFLRRYPPARAAVRGSIAGLRAVSRASDWWSGANIPRVTALAENALVELDRDVAGTRARAPRPGARRCSTPAGRGMRWSPSARRRIASTPT